MNTLTRGFLLGLVVPIAVALTVTAIGAQYVPDSPLLGSLARMLESTAPQLLLTALPVVLVVAALGARRLALGVGLGMVAAAALLVVQHRTVSHPAVPTANADLTVIWFNLHWTNRTDPGQIAEALIASDADIVILAEPGAVRSMRQRLAEAYPHQAGCQGPCGMVVLSRIPFDLLAVQRPGPMNDDRMMVLGINVDGRAPLTLVGLHLIKPWYYGIAEQEIDTVFRTLARYPGPMVLAGDLNSAPWSKRLRKIVATTDLILPRIPIPTWPAQAGSFGIPLDHVMVRGGPVLRRLEPWGMGLGSDHRGLRAEFALPESVSTSR